MIKDEKKHWNTIAPSYDNEVQDVYRSNKKKKLQRLIAKYANKNDNAIDFGCGTGNGFEYLAPHFHNVLGTDISQNCLDLARQLGYPNVTYQQTDLTDETVRFPKVEFAMCCNVAILPEPQKNHIIFKNVRQALKKKGIAIFVLPALESILLSARHMITWYEREGVQANDIPPSELGHFKSLKDIYQGLVTISGVVTKHYFKEEIAVVCQDARLRIKKIDKLEYSWKTEFDTPPAWMGPPYPWDWVVVCKRD